MIYKLTTEANIVCVLANAMVGSVKFTKKFGI